MKINIDLSMTELGTTLESFKAEARRAEALSVENNSLRSSNFDLRAKLGQAESDLGLSKQNCDYLREDLQYWKNEMTRWETKYRELEIQLKRLSPNEFRTSLEKHARYNEVAAYIARGEKINAIRLTREILHIGLKEAKDTVESILPMPDVQF